MSPCLLGADAWLLYAQVSSRLQDLRLSLGYQTKIHLVMAAIRLQISCKWTKRRATWSIVALPPWQCGLPTLSASLQSPPSLPYDDFISSGLRALYRIPLRGLPLSPARRGTGSCKCVRSWAYKSIAESRLDPISAHDLSRHANPVSSVHYKSDSDMGRKSPQDYRGVSFIPGPPSCSGVVLWATFRLLLFW